VFDIAAVTALPAGTGFKLHLNGLAQAGPIVLYASTNLADWQPIFTNAPVLGSWEYAVPSTNAGPIFYRASELR
jgi:hypothetical protein